VHQLTSQAWDSIRYSSPSIFLDFASEFSLISQEKELFGADYPLVCYILVKTIIIIHLSVSEEW